MGQLVKLEESSRVDIVEIVEHDAMHRQTSEYLVQVDVIVRALEQPLAFIVPVEIPQSISHLMYNGFDMKIDFWIISEANRPEHFRVSQNR